MKKSWIDEVARDLIAFGGLPFLVITIARVSVGQPYYPMQFIIGSALFFVLKAVFKGDLRAGVGFILVFFTSLFYRHILFTIFAAIIYTGLIASLFYFRRERNQVLKGIFFGGISAAISYLAVKFIFF